MKHFVFVALASAVLLAGCSKGDSHLPRAIDKEAAVHIDSVFQSVPLSGSVNEIHSLMVIQEGKVIYERYSPGQEPDYYHILWSATKSYTSIAVGFAVQEGLLSVDDKVRSFFTEDEVPAYADSLQNAWLDKMTIKDLLMMSSGLQKDYLAAVGAGILPDPVRSIFEAGILFEPGYRFSYNSMNSHILSVILTKVTGMTEEEYLTPRFFKPLGINRHIWETATDGCNKGGWGLHITTESFAKTGLFLLQNGCWDGKQLLSSDWVAESTASHIDSSINHKDPDWAAGYCYQYWRNHIPGSYRLDGAWGQFCVVIPDKNAVIACNCHTWGTTPLLDAIWQYVYPNI